MDDPRLQTMSVSKNMKAVIVMKENEFQRQVINKLRSCGCEILNCHGHAMQAPGWPDLYVSGPVDIGWRGWLELKVGKGGLREVQRLKMKALNARQDWSYVLRLWNSPRIDQFEVEAVNGKDGVVSVIFCIKGDDWRGMTGKELLTLLVKCDEVMRKV